MKFKDKVVLVTGAGQGLGKAFSHAFATEGARVIVAEINEEKGHSTAEEINSQGLKAIFIRTDVSNETSVNGMARAVADRYGRIDVLINNAGILASLKLKSFLEITLEEWNKVMATNITGMFLCCKAVVPIMKARNRGKIVNLSSGTVLIGRPFYLHYVTSKAAVIGLTRALAREVGDWNICVNALAPGSIKTEIQRDTSQPDKEQEMIKRRCLKREGIPQDLFGALMFLSSEDSDFITGQVINIDGGLHHY